MQPGRDTPVSFQWQGKHGADIDSTRYQIIAAAIRIEIRWPDKVENRKGFVSAIVFFVNPMNIISLHLTQETASIDSPKGFSYLKYLHGTLSCIYAVRFYRAN